MPPEKDKLSLEQMVRDMHRAIAGDKSLGVDGMVQKLDILIGRVDKHEERLDKSESTGKAMKILYAMLVFVALVLAIVKGFSEPPFIKKDERPTTEKRHGE